MEEIMNELRDIKQNMQELALGIMAVYDEADLLRKEIEKISELLTKNSLGRETMMRDLRR
jgi:uncharacterized coiled-coil DUF342 family protein